MGNRPEEENPPPVEILADETGEGSDSYARLPKRLSRYAVARHRAEAMSKYIAALPQLVNDVPAAADLEKVLHELENCGSYLVFRHYLQSDRVRLHGMRSCHQHLICPLCAIRRGARLLGAYMARVNVVVAANPNLKAYMVTCTVKNGADLAERFKHLRSGIKALNLTRRGRGSSEWGKAAGGVYSYEAKRGNDSGLWHPHGHAVLLSEVAIDQATLRDEWHAITGDSFMCEVHPMYGELADAFLEVFKYAIKFGDLPLVDNWEAFGVLRRRRLIGSFGVLRGVVVPDDLTDELLEESEWIDYMYRYFNRGGADFGYSLSGSWEGRNPS